MRGFVKLLLASAVLAAGLVFADAQRAEAARWRVFRPYAGYHAPYVYRPLRAPHYAYYPGYYVVPRVRVGYYRAPVVVAPPVVVSPYYYPAPVIGPGAVYY